MAIYAREPESKYTPAPEGLHPAVCCDVVDLGLVDDGFGQRHKVEIRWQLDLEVEDGSGRPVLVRKRYNNSLHEKATLRKDLETWRGRPFSKEELQGFDLEKLIGVSCQAQVMHRITDDGKTYANVVAVIALGKGMTKLRVSEDYVRERDRVKEPPVDRASNGAADEDDDIPF